ncbi:hypothetical protein, partial [Microcoleus sp. OTE_8_concoct_300]|uniref:hypothetical protein n=1 Tax=Microcoleus sp. OTE_8_concoct_300 TaxID=2964710 RepID=UPI00403F2B16
EALTPRINSGGKFLGYRFFISGRMNPGACILDAFGQLLAGIVGEGSPYKNPGLSTGHDITYSYSDSSVLDE